MLYLRLVWLAKRKASKWINICMLKAKALLAEEKKNKKVQIFVLKQKAVKNLMTNLWWKKYTVG